MKYWGITVFILAACLPALGAGVNEYEFVSALSVAEASFQEVETKSVDHPTKFGANTVFNVGAPSTEGNISGDINVKGKPIQVDTLNMNNSTSVANNTNTKWLVDTLNIRANGAVHVETLLAGEVNLENKTKDKSTGLTANTLKTDTSTWAKDGEINKTGTTEETLQADWKDGSSDPKKFYFVPGTATTGAATWQQLKPKSDSADATRAATGTDSDYTKYYPIYTD
ncbi:MAG: hypothetical protein II913_04930 [Elusimicrobiaceae bacterium]|nr:hypothetical protein [Elusimicrobiaceae bacterium]